MSTAPQPAKTGAFGERMRREREMRGIKLEEIAESTKIGKRNLEALEQERFDQLPGGIFNKGFVRAYAKYLGLDEEQAVNDFLAASANYDQPSALAPPIPATWVKPPAMPSEASIRRKNRLWALTALLALVAGFALWFYYARVAQSGSRVAQPPSAVPSPRASAEVDLPGAPIAPPVQSRPSSTSNPLAQPPMLVWRGRPRPRLPPATPVRARFQPCRMATRRIRRATERTRRSAPKRAPRASPSKSAPLRKSGSRSRPTGSRFPTSPCSLASAAISTPAANWCCAPATPAASRFR